MLDARLSKKGVERKGSVCGGKKIHQKINKFPSILLINRIITRKYISDT